MEEEIENLSENSKDVLESNFKRTYYDATRFSNWLLENKLRKVYVIRKEIKQGQGEDICYHYDIISVSLKEEQTKKLFSENSNWNKSIL